MSADAKPLTTSEAEALYRDEPEYRLSDRILAEDMGSRGRGGMVTSAKERPLLFSAPMVRALLKGLKTQTRRVAKLVGPGYVKEPRGHRRWHPGDPEAVAASPYGGLGDKLWVKETFVFRSKHERYYYRADHPVHDPYAHDGWKPSIFMPRKASRITLEITAVRLERLQEISEEDAIAEGVERNVDDGVTYWGPLGEGHVDPRVAYRWLWESINGPGSWDANPWVWAISFPRIAP